MSYLKKTTNTNPLGKNAFDLSQKRLFTASTGELLPVYCAETLPGDHFEIRVDDFLRTQTCNTACFSRMKQYVHFFFVPYRCLSTKWANYITRSPRMESTAFSPFTGDGNSASFVNFKSQMTFPIYSTLIKLAFIKNSVRDDKLSDAFASGFPQSLFNDEDINRGFLAARALKLLDLLEYGVGNIDYSTINAVNQEQFTFSRQNDNGSFVGKSYSGAQPTEGTSTNAVVRARANAFRLLAYNRIYQDFYRDVRLEPFNSIYSNIDDRMSIVENPDNLSNNLFFGEDEYGSFTNPLFYIRYRNYPLDYATSADLNPFKQDSLLNALPFANSSSSGSVMFGINSNLDSTSSLLNGKLSDSLMGIALNTLNATHSSDSAYPSGAEPYLMRAQYALERWASRQAHAKSQSYSDLIKAHFGIEPSQLDSIFLGGTSAPVVISENIATAATEEANLGQLSGVGKSSLDNKTIKFDCKEHGVIMGIMSIAPEPDYNSWMIDKHNTKTLPEDWFTPEYDGLGYQAVSQSEILNNPMRYMASPMATSSVWPTVPFGYHPIYSEYRGKLDKVFGQFTSYQSLSYWVNSRNPYGTNNTINNNFMKVLPTDVDPIFQLNYLSPVSDLSFNFNINYGDYSQPSGFGYTKAVSINDQFFVNFETDVKAIRHMSSDGVIY